MALSIYKKNNVYYLNGAIGSSGGTAKPVIITIRSTYDPIGKALKNFFVLGSETIITDMAFDAPQELPNKFPAGTDIKTSVKTDQANVYCAIRIRGWLENE